MFKSELIVGEGSSAASLDLQTEIPISLNLSIADIREPEKRNGAYTKTIKLKGTDVNNKFFEHTFRVNITTISWNPNVKTQAYVLQGGSVVFEGYLRLLQINVTLVKGENDIEYEVSLFGDNNSLFAAIGDAKLEDLDLSTFDHVYSRENIIYSWTSQIRQGGSYVPFALGNGYVYPLIDYGYNNFATNSFPVETWRPAIYEKTYLDYIFASAGKTYTSNFLNTQFFKKQITPHNGEKFTMSAANLANREFKAGVTGTPSSQTTNLTNSGNNWVHPYMSTSLVNELDCIFNDDTTNPFTDPGGQYNTSTGIFTVASTGIYAINAVLTFEHKLTTVPVGTATIGTPDTFQNYHNKLLKSTDGGSTWSIAASSIQSYGVAPVFSSSSWVTVITAWSTAGMNLVAGEKYKFEVSMADYTNRVWFKDGGGSYLTTGPVVLSCRPTTSASLKVSLVNNSYSAGQVLSINDAIPKDIKQKDYLTSLFKKYNLYIDVDKDNPDNYIIETRDTFYSQGTTKDWSEKLDWGKPINIKPMSEINWKSLLFKYKNDNDYFNTIYQDKYQESYGTYTRTIINDFVKNEIKNELIFSATPVVDNPNNGLIIPKILSYDGTNVKPVKHNIRSLMYNGLIADPFGSWDFPSPVSDAFGGTVIQYGAYPEAAMVGSTTWGSLATPTPLSPTDSIEFGVPNEVFYTLGTNYTTNNLFNRFYSKQISEITDRDSKIVTAWFKLEPHDISQFDFRDTIFVRDAYYYVNKIIDYNPLSEDLTKVELLKIKSYDAYTPITVPVTTIETNVGNLGMLTARYGMPIGSTKFGEGENVLVGENISARGSGAIVSGTNISIDASSERINVVNCDDVNVFCGVSGFTSMNSSGLTIGASSHDISLINCNNVVISDYVYNYTGIGVSNKTITTASNNLIELGEAVSNLTEVTQTKQASFNIGSNVSTYFIDADHGANITAQFSSLAAGKSVTFIRIDSSVNLFYITNTGNTATLQGSACPVDLGMVQWDSITIHYDGTNFYIK